MVTVVTIEITMNFNVMDTTKSSALVLTTLCAVIISSGFCSRSRPHINVLASADDQLPYHKNQRRTSFVSYSGSDDDVDLNSIRDLLEQGEQQAADEEEEREEEREDEDEEEEEDERRRRGWLSQFSRPQQTEFINGRDRRAYAKKGRWQGFCFRRTRTGRRFPYICWRESDG